MPSRSDVELLLNANQGIRALTIRDLERFWATLDLNSPESARDRLLVFLPTLVERYGDLAATVSADWYSDVRAAASVERRFVPVLAAATSAVKVDATTRRLAAHLFTDDPGQMLESLKGTISKFALQSGPNTIIQSARMDPWKPRVARVPAGASTCSFCLMLASRGAVYASEASAGSLHKYHPYDDCQIVVVGRGDDLPEGYNPEELYDQYLEARYVETANAA